MPDQFWSSWGASVIGPSHLKASVPNQDAWMARRFDWGNVVVVSDGLGSKAHSDIGSKAVCLAVIEAAKFYENSPAANYVDILRHIQDSWLVKIAPFAAKECATTCLFAIQIRGIITVGRLGDGMIAACGDREENCFILSDNKQDSFSNFTNSLQQEFKPSQWEIVTVKSSDCNAVVLSTDGISDDILPEKQMTFAQEIYSTYSDWEPNEIKQDLELWLNDWPVPKHSDDKTIACLFKKRGSE